MPALVSPLSLSPLAQLDTLWCLVLRLGAQRVKVYEANKEENMRRLSHAACLQEDMLGFCDNAAVFLAWSVTAISHLELQPMASAFTDLATFLLCIKKK